MERHLALMRALLAQHGQQRILNTEPPSRPDGGYNWGRRGFDHRTLPGNQAMQMLNPTIQQLLANTKNPGYSHQAALTQRFMSNLGAQ